MSRNTPMLETLPRPKTPWIVHACAPAMLTLACVFGFNPTAHAQQFQLPSYEQVRSSYQPSDITLLDRNGVFIQRLRTELSVRRGQWTQLSDISPA
jgi:penicillin-binding protein 1C